MFIWGKRCNIAHQSVSEGTKVHQDKKQKVPRCTKLLNKYSRFFFNNMINRGLSLRFNILLYFLNLFINLFCIVSENVSLFFFRSSKGIEMSSNAQSCEPSPKISMFFGLKACH